LTSGPVGATPEDAEVSKKRAEAQEKRANAKKQAAAWKAANHSGTSSGVADFTMSGL